MHSGDGMKTAGSRTIILIVASLSSFLTPFMGSSVNIALPAIAGEFSMNAIALNWVSTSYLIATAVFLLPIGRAADIYGKKRIFIRGIAIFSLSSLLIIMSPSTGILLFFRVLQGIGSSMIFGTGVAILVAVYPPEERGRALGINVAATYLGLSLGPFIGGILTENFGWQSIFLVNVPIGIIVLALAAKGIREEKGETRSGGIDYKGSLIFSLSLIMVMYGFSRVPGFSGVWLIIAGTAGLALFVAWEKRAESPVLDIRLMTHNRAFAFSNLAAFIHYSATFAVTFLLSLYLQYVKAMTPQEAGLVLVSQPFVMMALSPLAGRLSDRIEPRILASAGMAMTCLGLVMFAFLREDTGLAEILAALVIIGLGFALFSSPNTNAIMSAVDKKMYGVASGMIATMRITGQMVSMGVALMLFAVFIGEKKITPEIYPDFMMSLHMGFLIFSVLCAAGAVASLARGRIHDGPNSAA